MGKQVLTLLNPLSFLGASSILVVIRLTILSWIFAGSGTTGHAYYSPWSFWKASALHLGFNFKNRWMAITLIASQTQKKRIACDGLVQS